MGAFVRWLDRRLYPEHGDNWDNSAFRSAVLAVMDSRTCLLDLGAGAGIVEQGNFRGLAQHVCGVDPDPRVLSNPYLDEARLGTGEQIPYPDAYFDVVIANNVLEHLTDPNQVFKEISRVLKPGGHFIGKTPNRRHYVPFIASLTPLWFHQAVNRWRGRAGSDTFPTYYRANTPGDVRTVGDAVGLSVVKISLIEGRPEYLRLTAPTYLAGWLYERAVNLVPALGRYRVIMIATMRKSPAAATGCSPPGERLAA